MAKPRRWRMAEQIRQRYAALLTERPLPENRVLRNHATENTLPGLASDSLAGTQGWPDQPATL